MNAAAAVFACSSATAAWILIGYPISLYASPRRPWRASAGRLPRVTVIIPAFHEREALPAKLRAMAELDYPADLLQTVVTVDEDPELADLARKASPGGLVLFSPVRRGKAAALTRALRAASGEILVFTDANNVLSGESMGAAMKHFADPDVWAVAGRRGEVGSAYDRYEDWIRRLESRSGSVAAMSGEFMAVRRECISGWPEGVVNDDLWLLCHVVRSGGRVVYEPRASSMEPRLAPDEELRRRSRMAAGRVMVARELAGLPTGFALRLVNHKFGRLGLPYLLMAMLCSSLAGSRHTPLRELAIAQLCVYAMGAAAIAGWVPPGRAGKVARAAGQLVVGNVAVTVGTVRALRGRQRVQWTPVSGRHRAR